VELLPVAGSGTLFLKAYTIPAGCPSPVTFYAF
jgi:hypothetical protein